MCMFQNHLWSSAHENCHNIQKVYEKCQQPASSSPLYSSPVHPICQCTYYPEGFILAQTLIVTCLQALRFLQYQCDRLHGNRDKQWTFSNLLGSKMQLPGKWKEAIKITFIHKVTTNARVVSMPNNYVCDSKVSSEQNFNNCTSSIPCHAMLSGGQRHFT